MRLLYFGPFWEGSTAFQMAEGFRFVPGVELVAQDTGAVAAQQSSFYARVRWRLHWPVDELGENRKLLEATAAARPDAVIVDNCRTIRSSTLRQLRELGVKTLAYFTPDDALNPRALSRQLKGSFPEWDVFFTSKTFNIAELKLAGVRNPRLIGKAFDPSLHRPLSRAAVGEEYEKFDFVFVGFCERERLLSVNRLCESGFSVVVYGGDLGRWNKSAMHPGIVRRQAIFGEGYVRALHHGKIALCFLRKASRDRITQRTMEITACGRPMLAEKTDEHDAHFVDGDEYAGFRDDDELVALAKKYIADDTARLRLGERGRRRCLESDYSTNHRALEMTRMLFP